MGIPQCTHARTPQQHGPQHDVQQRQDNQRHQFWMQSTTCTPGCTARAQPAAVQLTLAPAGLPYERALTSTVSCAEYFCMCFSVAGLMMSTVMALCSSGKLPVYCSHTHITHK
jgi:hypothetical protein